jgi:methanol--5-hydroxybenzimidazolylcobamide Co-methyltransferase
VSLTPPLDTERTYDALAIKSNVDFLFSKAPIPVRCGRGMYIGGGTVYPEINVSLLPIGANRHTSAEIKQHFKSTISLVCERATALDAPGLIIAFNAPPSMPGNPKWGLDVTSILSEELRKAADKNGLGSALRLTFKNAGHPDHPLSLIDMAAEAGADMLTVESTVEGEAWDEAILNTDLRKIVFALGVLVPRDMSFLWQETVRICRRDNIVPAGIAGCQLANTAMQLAHKKLAPRVLAAIARVAAVPRALVAYEMGAVGPSSGSALEGPYLKAIAGVPVSMEGRSASRSHLTSTGNIAQAVCDCWSNGSAPNDRSLAETDVAASVEQVIYDCRLINVSGRTREGALQMRDWLVESDGELDPQAHILRPDVVLNLSRDIVAERSPYSRTRAAVLSTLEELSRCRCSGDLQLAASESSCLNKLQAQADLLPVSESDFIESMSAELSGASIYH